MSFAVGFEDSGMGSDGVEFKWLGSLEIDTVGGFNASRGSDFYTFSSVELKP